MRITCPGCLCVYVLDDKDHDGHLSSVQPPRCETCEEDLRPWFEVYVLYRDPALRASMDMVFQMTGINTIDDLKDKIRNAAGLSQQYDLVLYLGKNLLEPHRNWGQRELCDFGFTLGSRVEAFPDDPLDTEEEDREWAAQMAEMWERLWKEHEDSGAHEQQQGDRPQLELLPMGEPMRPVPDESVIGKVVKISGLTQRPDLNGCYGRVTCLVKIRGRVGVHVEGAGDFSIRTENLWVVASFILED